MHAELKQGYRTNAFYYSGAKPNRDPLCRCYAAELPLLVNKKQECNLQHVDVNNASSIS